VGFTVVVVSVPFEVVEVVGTSVVVLTSGMGATVVEVVVGRSFGGSPVIGKIVVSSTILLIK
jgi:hypothetical protein